MIHSEILTMETLQPDLPESQENLDELFSLHNIYSYHHTPEQADEVLELVQPDSIVFCEGYLRTREYAAARLAQLHQLANGRLKDKAFYDANQALVTETTDEFVERRLAPTEKVNEFGYRLFKGLFAKNCIVLPADYFNLEGASEAFASPMSEEAWQTLFSSLSPDTLDTFVEFELARWGGTVERSTVRERAAVQYIVRYLNAIHQSNTAGQLATTEEGLTSVNIIYGLAHRVSLTNKLAGIGLRGIVTVVNNSPVPTEDLPDIEQELHMDPEDVRTRIAAHYSALLQAELE